MCCSGGLKLFGPELCEHSNCEWNSTWR